MVLGSSSASGRYLRLLDTSEECCLYLSFNWRSPENPQKGMKMKGVKNWRKAAKFLNAHVWKSDPTDLFSRTSYLAALTFTTVFENSTKCLIFSCVRAKRAAHGHIKKCFLKEIGILKHFVLRKSEKIGKIENMIWKRHLAISLIFQRFFAICIVNVWILK